MPFPLIPAVLALCFLLMWALIAGMIFRDGQLAVRRERDWDRNIIPVARNHKTSAARFSATRKNRRRVERAVRVAS